MMNEIPVREWIAKYDAAIEAMQTTGNMTLITELSKGTWYDWFCKDTSLVKKTIALGKKLKRIANSGKFSLDTNYVWFKNNCPFVGRLYDDFRIADLKTGNVQFTIIPKSGHDSEHGMGGVWGKANNFKGAIFTGSWGEIAKWFNKE